MLNPAQFLLELGLVVWTVTVLTRRGWPAVHQPTLWIVTLGSIATNTAVFVAGYDILLKLSGISPEVLLAAAVFQVTKWAVVAYLMTRLALTLLPSPSLTGFALLQRERTLPQIVLTGFGVAVLAVVVVVSKFMLELAIGLHEANMWPAFLEKAAVMRPMIFWAGLRNLVGEELMPQLGIQTLVLCHAGQRKWTGVVSILCAALFFEVWHDGFQYLYFNNFLFGLFFAWAYRRYGYETAAVAHCFVDWLLYLALPLLPI